MPGTCDAGTTGFSGKTRQRRVVSLTDGVQVIDPGSGGGCRGARKASGAPDALRRVRAGDVREHADDEEPSERVGKGRGGLCRLLV